MSDRKFLKRCRVEHTTKFSLNKMTPTLFEGKIPVVETLLQTFITYIHFVRIFGILLVNLSQLKKCNPILVIYINSSNFASVCASVRTCVRECVSHIPVFHHVNQSRERLNQISWRGKFECNVYRIDFNTTPLLNRISPPQN